MTRRLIEAGAGRRPPARTTEEIRQSITFPKHGPEWLRILKMRFGHHLSNGVTRREMAELYEKALSETLQNYDELQQKVWELENDNRSHTAAIEDLLKRKKDLEHRLGQTGRRLWSVLDLLEKRFYDEVGMKPTSETDYYFDGESMYED